MARLEPAPPPTPDGRAPEEMPTTGTVEWFDSSRGFGVLVVEGGRYTFDYVGASSATVAGTTVVITWKRARTGGWNVPATVQSTAAAVAAAHVPPTFTLAAWLTAARPIVGDKLAGITAKTLIENNSDILEDWPTREKRDASSAWFVLSAVASLERPDPWIGTFDWKGSDEWSVELPPMLGIATAPDASSFREFIAKCNALATNGNQLYSLPTGGDHNVVIAVPPEVCAALVAAGLVEIDADAPTAPENPSVFTRIRSWITGS